MTKQSYDAFQVIADPGRRHILKLLTKDSMTINELADNFDMSHPAVSKHAKILYNAGFIAIQNIGRERHCTLKPDGFSEVQEWMDYFDQFWNQKLNALDKLLSEKGKSNEKRHFYPFGYHTVIYSRTHLWRHHPLHEAVRL